jgi:phosphoadenosine phosphosulfate reductase
MSWNRPEEVLREVADRFGEHRLALAASWQKESSVLVDLVQRVAPGARIFTLDTGALFEETYATWRAIEERYGITVEAYRGEWVHGLWASDPDRCCFLRKVEPLERALADYDAWAAGLRRDESPTRANTPVVAFDPKRGKVKVNPIAAWTQADVDQYIARWNVPVNELFKKGYGSIGCWPCTRRTKAGEDPRAGRWAMFEKTECGLHV